MEHCWSSVAGHYPPMFLTPVFLTGIPISQTHFFFLFHFFFAGRHTVVIFFVISGCSSTLMNPDCPKTRCDEIGKLNRKRTKKIPIGNLALGPSSSTSGGSSAAMASNMASSLHPLPFHPLFQEHPEYPSDRYPAPIP